MPILQYLEGEGSVEIEGPFYVAFIDFQVIAGISAELVLNLDDQGVSTASLRWRLDIVSCVMRQYHTCMYAYIVIFYSGTWNRKLSLPIYPYQIRPRHRKFNLTSRGSDVGVYLNPFARHVVLKV